MQYNGSVFREAFMKKIVFLTLFLVLSVSLTAQEPPTAEIKLKTKKDKEVSLKIPLLIEKGGITKLNASGKAARKLEKINDSCCTDGDVKEENFQVLKAALKLYNKDVTLDDVKSQCSKIKGFKEDPNYAEPLSYGPNENLSKYFIGKKKDKGELQYFTCSRLKSRTTPSQYETLDEQLKRCSEGNPNAKTKVPQYDNTLECRTEYGCTVPSTVQEQETEIAEEPSQTLECNGGPALFKSNSSVVDDSTNIQTCLNDMPSDAKNIKIFFECCSSTVKRVVGTNLDLTLDRQTALKKVLVKMLSDKGFKESSYSIEPASNNENYYYDKKTGDTEVTGTCGPLTNNPLSYEPWVAKYKDDTKAYMESKGLSGNAHFDWITMKNQEASPTDPDAALAIWRNNKVSITYTVTPTTSTVPVKDTDTDDNAIKVGVPSVKCLRVVGHPDTDPIEQKGKLEDPKSSAGKVSSIARFVCEGMTSCHVKAKGKERDFGKVSHK